MEYQVLRMKERVQMALDIGESHFREFKSALQGDHSSKAPRPVKDICKDIGETLVAFANADGGELLIGVEDDSTLKGVTHTEKDIEKMMQAPKTHVHPRTPLTDLRFAKVDLSGSIVLYFQTAKSSDKIHLTADGRCLQRKDRESVPIPPHMISFQRQEAISRKYDREFIDDAFTSDLDVELVQDVADNMSKGLSIEKFLQHLSLAEYTTGGVKLTRAALLLFAKDISRWHSRVQVRFVKVAGTEIRSGDEYNASEVGLVTGNMLSLITETWEKLRPFLVQTKLSSGAIFETKVMYPELACREAIINAIAHRDYSIEGRGIEIYIYDDRLEIKSPGMLLSTISMKTLKELKGAHESRNALVTRVLREKGFMRELGEGMRRIYELFKKNELSPPELLSKNDNFVITLHHKSVYTEEQRLWLDEFKNDDLTPEERAIVLLGYDNNVFSPYDIRDAVGIVDTEDYRKLVRSLQDKGILAGKYGKINQAKKIAKINKIPFRQFKRYYIIVPKLRGEARKGIGRIIEIDYEPDYEETRIYVTNIPYSISHGDLYEIFSSVGNVLDLIIPYNHEINLPRGFAFIAFDTKKEAEEAISKFNGTFLGGRKIAVSFAYKRKKEKNIG